MKFGFQVGRTFRTLVSKSYVRTKVLVTFFPANRFVVYPYTYRKCLGRKICEVRWGVRLCYVKWGQELGCVPSKVMLGKENIKTMLGKVVLDHSQFEIAWHCATIYKIWWLGSAFDFQRASYFFKLYKDTRVLFFVKISSVNLRRASGWVPFTQLPTASGLGWRKVVLVR